MQRNDQDNNAHLDSVPDEILLAIADGLAPQEISSLNQTNRLWHAFTQDEVLWQRKLQQHFPHWQSRKQSEQSWHIYFMCVYELAYENLTPAQRNFFSYVKEHDLGRIETGFATKKFNLTDLFCEERVPEADLCGTGKLFYAITRDTDILTYILKLMTAHKTTIESLPEDISFSALSVVNGLGLSLMSETCRKQFYRLAIARGHIEIIKELLESDYSFLTTDEPLIVQAVRQQQLALVKLLHETYQHDVNEVQASGANAFYMAAKIGNIDIIRYLIDNGADVTKTFKGFSPLYTACQMGHLAAVKLLLPYYNINAEAIDGSTPLYVAAQKGHADVVSYLLRQGADVTKTFKGFSPLYIACQMGHLAAVKLLLPYYNINAEAIDGSTPLYIAAQKGHAELVGYLLQQGAIPKTYNAYTPMYIAAKNGFLAIVELLVNPENINQASNEGDTPLYIAAQNGHLAVVKYLLAKGADPHLTFQGHTPLYVAGQNGHVEIVNLLLPLYDINMVAPIGATLLYTAAQNGHTDTAKILLKHGADASLCYLNSYSPLYIAAQKGHVEVVELLVAKGMINHATQKGATPLYVAAQYGHLNVMQLLLQHEADVNKRFKNGFSAIHNAAKHEQYEAVKLLLKHDARVLCPHGKVIDVPTTPEIQLLLTLKIQIEQAQLVLKSPLAMNSVLSGSGNMQLTVMQKILTDLLENKLVVEMNGSVSVKQTITDLIAKYSSASRTQAPHKLC